MKTLSEPAEEGGGDEGFSNLNFQPFLCYFKSVEVNMLDFGIFFQLMLSFF